MKTRLVIILSIALLCFEGLCQEVGNKVRLQSTNPQGAPVHPAAGNTSYVRWANGTEGTVKAIDAASGWLQIESQGQTVNYDPNRTIDNLIRVSAHFLSGVPTLTSLGEHHPDPDKWNGNAVGQFGVGFTTMTADRHQRIATV